MSESETESDEPTGESGDEAQPVEMHAMGLEPNDPDSLQGSGMPLDLGVQGNEPDLVEKQDPAANETRER